MKKVRFLPDNIEIEIEQGESLLKAAQNAGIRISSNCGGQGVCGKCILKLIKGDTTAVDQKGLSKEQVDQGCVLSCKTMVESDMIVEVPAFSRLSDGNKVAQRFSSDNLVDVWRSSGKVIDLIVDKVYLELTPPCLDRTINDCENLKNTLNSKGIDAEMDLNAIRQVGDILRENNYKVTASILKQYGISKVIKVAKGDKTQRRYGVAVDIGTTSVVVYLVDLLTAKISASESCYNSQVRHGDDVISRMVYTEQEDGLLSLQKLIVEDINRLVGNICLKTGIEKDDIETIYISGNSTMMHLLYKVNPLPIREEPYVTVINQWPVLSCATEVGIDINAVLISVPGVASYVGGDIVSGVIASGIQNSEEVNIFIDIGTNGEVVVGNSEWLISAACSAGPCFEGSTILCGMRATDGAIEEMDIDPDTFDVRLGVIGNGKPVGICGSGMIDAMANMLLAGIINQKGQFIDNRENERIRAGHNGKEFVLAWKEESSSEKDIVLTQVDIENLIRAKGAIYAGMATLLSQVSMTFEDVNSIIIAGGFGKYINVKKAKIIGLLPDVEDEKFVFMGNTSVTGAYLALLSGDYREITNDVARQITNVELSVLGSFMDEYVSALFLPHTNMATFPNIRKLFNNG